MNHKKFALMVFLFSPLAVLALLCVLIARSIGDPTIRKMPPVGAGAGDTGGANFIGDRIAESRAAHSPAPVTPVNGHVSAEDAQDGAMVNPVTLDTGFMIVVQDKTAKATPSSPIYLAGSINGWNPGHEQFKLTAQSDMRWRLHITKEMLKGAPSTVEFKFTRGAWSVEELNADFTVPANKMLPLIPASRVKAGEPPTIEYTVVAWSDTSPNFAQQHVGEAYRPVIATGTLKRLQVQGGAGDAKGQTRDLLVWLPPGYDNSANGAVTYPVLYMHDGQNLFEKHANVPAEWRADEVATELITGGKARPFIIVGIPHSGATRIVEYMPPGFTTPFLQGRAPEGDTHVAWLIGSVMPRVEATFRVAKGPENTGVGGSSMGGLISIYAGATHPDVFGLVLAESPALRLGAGSQDGRGQGAFESVKAWPSRIFIGVGGREGTDNPRLGEQFASAVKDFDAMLAAKGLGADRRQFVFEAEAVHDEGAWAARLPRALTFLFPPVAGSKK